MLSPAVAEMLSEEKWIGQRKTYPCIFNMTY